MPKYTAVVMLLSLLLYFWLGFRVGQARVKFRVPAPATAVTRTLSAPSASR